MVVTFQQASEVASSGGGVWSKSGVERDKPLVRISRLQIAIVETTGIFGFSFLNVITNDVRVLSRV